MADNMEPGMGAEAKQLGVDVRVYRVAQSSRGPGNLLAFASATVGGCFAVKNIRILKGKKGPFVSMPRAKDRDGNFYDVCFPVTKEMRDALYGAVLGEYQQVTEKASVRSALADAAKETMARPTPEAIRSADRGVR